LGYGTGCSDEQAQVLPLRVHSLAGCDLPPELRHGSLELLALGDFSASNESAEILPLDRRSAALKFPVATRAVEARVSGGVKAFAGYGERRNEGGLDVLLWPKLSTCEVSRANGAQGYPGKHGGQALGFAESTGVVVAAGGNDPLVSDAIVGALSFDVAGGDLRALDTSDDGVLQKPRAFATLTPFGDKLLIAGGETPVFGVPETDIEPLASAEIFDPRSGRFTGEQIQLQSTRTHHAALTLDDGRTLLVGGRSKVGSTSIAQYQLEIVDPRTQRASVAGTIAPRIDARALRLSDGRVFIGGGVDHDGALSEPIAEWLTPSGTPTDTKLSSDVTARFNRAFVALEGGAALAVGGCEDRAFVSDPDAEACALACGHGCPPTSYDAWWIEQNGAATRIELPGISAPKPILLRGSDGSPWLIAANAAAPDSPRLFRFNPWTPGFVEVSLPDEVTLPKPGLPQPLCIAPDTFVWIDDDDQHGALLGLRLGTRNRYAQDLALVLASDPLDPTRPQHLVPDRAPAAGVSYDGRLTLSGEVTVLVADTDYEDVTLDVHLLGDVPPLVLLGGVELGGEACPWPSGAKQGGDFDLATVARHGRHAELRFHGGKAACEVEAGRLSLGVRRGALPSTITQMDVTRAVTGT
jgi:hypothetical protein